VYPAFYLCAQVANLPSRQIILRGRVFRLSRVLPDVPAKPTKGPVGWLADIQGITAEAALCSLYEFNSFHLLRKEYKRHLPGAAHIPIRYLSRARPMHIICAVLNCG